MSTAAAALQRTSWRRQLRLTSVDPERLTAWALGFAPVFYLAMSGGGYDIVARSEVGLFLWWLVLLGALLGLLPRIRLTAIAWIGVGLLGAYLAWTWVAVGWSASEERTLAEVARVATYLGVLVLGLCVVRQRTSRDLVNGLACAIALVSALAVLSRLVPSWFPSDTAQGIYATARLRYPFDYSDAVGEFAALGLPLLLYAAVSARSIRGRALGAAALPVVVVCLAMTVSRGGLLAAVVGVAFFLALMPERLAILATAATATVGSAVAVWALLSRPSVRDEFILPAPSSQRHAVLASILFACIGVGLVQAGLTVALRPAFDRGRLMLSRRGAAVGAAVLGIIALAGLAALIATGTDHTLWQEFKRPNPIASHNQYRRLLSLAGSHRYQYWQVAIDAFNAHPWKGIGPGTFEFYWAQHNSLAEFVRNAHSLYIETLAELGVIGLVVVGGFVVFTLVAGSARALFADVSSRRSVAAGVAAFAAFAAAASFDWVWQIGAIPFAAMLLAAVALGAGRSRVGDDRYAPRRILLATRVVLAGGFVVALVAITIPLGSTIEVRSSQSAARRGDYTAALRDARSAKRIEPAAATPRVQSALLLEALGGLRGADQAIVEAEAREPTNWRIWLIASRLHAENNRPKLALADYRRARSLNPSSPLFRR